MSENKIRNAHCVYFEGQTGLCKAKEFVKCNPVNCKLYTIDELSTILDLQEQLKHKEQECEKLKTQTSNFMNGEYCADGCKKMYKQFAKAHNNLVEENKKLKQECQNLINTQYYFKNELKKYKKAVRKYKVVLQDKIKRLHLSRREFLREINSVPVRIACRGEGFKNALNNFNNAIQVINNEDKYKQALEEIKNYQQRNCETCAFANTQKCNINCQVFVILDIINKAKEQK